MQTGVCTLKEVSFYIFRQLIKNNMRAINWKYESNCFRKEYATIEYNNGLPDTVAIPD